MQKSTPLRRARIQAGLSQSELAEKVGITQGSLSEMERMECRPSPDVAEKLAAILGVSEMQLLYPQRYLSEDK